MHIKTTEKGDVTIFEVQGEINITTSPELKRAFEKVKSVKLIINLAGVGYVDSSGLATLVEILKRLRSRGGSLSLTQVTEKVKSLFEITKLEKLFGIYASDQTAFESLQ